MTKVLRYDAPPGATRIFTEEDFQNVEVFDQAGFSVEGGRSVEVTDTAAEWLTINEPFVEGELDPPVIEPLAQSAPQLSETVTVKADAATTVTFGDGTSLVWDKDKAEIDVPRAYASELLSYPNFTSNDSAVAESVPAPSSTPPASDDASSTSPTPEDVSETPEDTASSDDSSSTAKN